MVFEFIVDIVLYKLWFECICEEVLVIIVWRYLAGNILLSFVILMVEVFFSKIFLVLKYMGMFIYSVYIYFVY